MKKLIFSLIIITLLVCAIPFTIGVIVENQINQLIHTYNQNQSVNLQLSSYKRGWLSSTIIFNIEIDKAYAALAHNSTNSIDFNVETTITHGPIVVYQNQPTFAILAINNASSPIKLNTRLNEIKFKNRALFSLNGLLEGKFSLLPIAGILNNKVDFALDGIDIDYRAKLNYETTQLDTFDSKIVVSPFSINQAQAFNLTLNQLIIAIEGALTSQFLVNNLNIQAKKLIYKENISANNISINQIDAHIAPHNHEGNWLANINSKISAENIVLNNKRYDQSRLDITINDPFAAKMMMSSYSAVWENLLEQILVQQLTVWELIQSRRINDSPLNEILNVIPSEVYESIINASLNTQLVESIPNPNIVINDLSLSSQQAITTGSGWFYTDLFKNDLMRDNSSLTAFEATITMQSQQWINLFEKTLYIREAISNDNISAANLSQTLFAYLASNDMLDIAQNDVLTSHISYANGVIKFNNKPLYLILVENDIKPSK